jgi:IclR family pca regulon transcriptional regulator
VATEEFDPASVVQSLERGLAVIRAFDQQHPELTLSEVARLTGLTRAAARRFLHTLVHVGYMRTDGRKFSLRPRVLELGYSYLSSLSLPDIAMPHLEELVSQVHETTSVSVYDEGDVIYVARVPVKRIMTLSIAVGSRFPAYTTSMGRVLLAGLDAAELKAYLDTIEFMNSTPHTVANRTALAAEINRVRKQGWCIVDQELEQGIISAACPIRAADSSIIAAANISTPVSHNNIARVRSELLPALLETAAAIQQDLIRVGFSSVGSRTAIG